MRKRVLASMLLAALLAISLVAAGCAPKEQASDVVTVKIGAIFPLTGSAAATGVKLKYAVETAQEIINGEHPEIDLPLAKDAGLPGLGGAKVEFVFADHQANPEVAKSEAERLIENEDVVGLIGCYHSSCTKPASAAAETYGIPFVAGSSSSAALTERGLKYFVRIAPHDGKETEFFFEYLNYLNEKYDAGIKTVAMVYVDNEYGVHAAKMVDQWLEEKYAAQGYEKVADVKYPVAASNVDAEVQKVKAADPDVIFHASYINDMTMFVKTYKQFNVAPKAVISYCGGFQDPQFIVNLGDDANYFSGSNATIPAVIEKAEVLKKINEIYKSKSGVDFDGPSLEDFASAMVIADAINQAGSTDGDAIMEVLKEATFEAPYFMVGKIKFGEDGQNEFSASFMTQVLDGEYQAVWPEEAQTAEPVPDIPDWGDR